MEKKTMACSFCSKEDELMFPEEMPYFDSGWTINFLSLGHYGGFTDPIPDLEDSVEKWTMHMCHDCCVKMVETFPVLEEHVRGGHPNRNEHDSDNGIETPPCCPYAWTWVRDKSQEQYDKQFTVYYATQELLWEKAH